MREYLNSLDNVVNLWLNVFLQAFIYLLALFLWDKNLYRFTWRRYISIFLFLCATYSFIYGIFRNSESFEKNLKTPNFVQEKNQELNKP